MAEETIPTPAAATAPAAPATPETAGEKKAKKKNKKNVLNGIVHIQSTFNNTLITFTDITGNVISWSSAGCLLYTSPSPRDRQKSRMPSSA